jgi:hypothetical protein
MTGLVVAVFCVAAVVATALVVAVLFADGVVWLQPQSAKASVALSIEITRNL